MREYILNKLNELSDSEYQKKQIKISSNIKNNIGVRLPALRRFAKEISKNDCNQYISTADNEYYEEIMLQGFLIGYIKINTEERLKLISNFIPKINNWAICDSFCASLKFTKNNMERVWNFIQYFLVLKDEYKVRFSVVMLLNYYINDEYIDKTMDALNNVKHDGYYVKMAAAWAISICYIKFPDKTMIYLKNNSLDDFTYNKTLQKIIESNHTDELTKKNIQNMKRK